MNKIIKTSTFIPQEILNCIEPTSKILGVSKCDVLRIAINQVVHDQIKDKELFSINNILKINSMDDFKYTQLSLYQIHTDYIASKKRITGLSKKLIVAIVLQNYLQNKGMWNDQS